MSVRLDPDDSGRALVFGPSDIFPQRQVLCGQRLIDDAEHFPALQQLMCILPVSEPDPCCPRHGERQAVS